MKKINIFALLSVTLFSLSASATKCLRAQTFEDLKKDFPIVVRGKIAEREKSSEGENSFSLKIQVVKVIHGEFKDKFIKASETHYGKGFWRIYEVGKEYTFPITPVGKKGTYEVTLPLDGCPEFPMIPENTISSSDSENFGAIEMRENKYDVLYIITGQVEAVDNASGKFKNTKGISIKIDKTLAGTALAKPDGSTLNCSIDSLVALPDPYVFDQPLDLKVGERIFSYIGYKKNRCYVAHYSKIVGNTVYFSGGSAKGGQNISESELPNFSKKVLDIYKK